MAVRASDIRWIKRYRVFFVAGCCIMVLQILLAYVFLVISDIDERNTFAHLSEGENEPIEGLYSKHELQNTSAHQLNSAHVGIRPNTAPKRKVPPEEATELQPEDLDFVPPCSIKAKETISAIHRAKTQHCKQVIANISCLATWNQLYPTALPHLCPSDLARGKTLGCYDDDGTARLLNQYSVLRNDKNTPENCINVCTKNGYVYAGVQYGVECFCGNDQPPVATRMPDHFCNMTCSGDPREMCGGHFKLNVYQTGLAKFQHQSALEDEFNPLSSHSASSAPSIRIAYLLTLNGRSTRQVHRLVRALFHRDHFFLIHVDARQDYLFRELLSLELRLPNVRLSRRRQSTIWGGASLISTLLDAMHQLLESGWQWDFFINLSESDYPVKTNQQLVAFLGLNRDRNFVKSHGRDTAQFIQKQGLDKNFVECEAHMWRVGDRNIPRGIAMDGGSDWLCLSRPFVSYVASSDKDELVSGLLQMFRLTLLPAESFFHTVLRNSIHCSSYVDNNLHTTNWQRSRGCRCQYRHIVDWCGCSPNNFIASDISRLKATQKQQIYFARKFEAIIDQTVINQLDEYLYGVYPRNMSALQSYWENIYHHSDLSPPPDDALVTIATSLSRLAIRFGLKSCHRTRSDDANNNGEQSNGFRDSQSGDHVKRYHDNHKKKNRNIENILEENEIVLREPKDQIDKIVNYAGEVDANKEESDGQNLAISEKNHMRDSKDIDIVLDVHGDNRKHGSNQKHDENGKAGDSRYLLRDLKSERNGNQFNGDGRSDQPLERRTEISFQDNNVEQMFVYKHDDKYKGTVIQYKLTLTEFIGGANDPEVEEDTIVEIQTLVQPKSAFNILQTDAFSRKLKKLEVSSSYDQKEQLTRNFLHALGPYSEPVLIHTWLSDITYNVTYLWIDPTNVLASVTDVVINENTTIDYVKSGLKSPLLPGEWQVKLVWNSQVYADINFLVTPLEFLNKMPLTQTQTKFIHGGTHPYPVDTSRWSPFLEGGSDRESLELKAAFDLRRFGFDLQQWIDSLVVRWYTIGESCVLSPTDIALRCSSHSLKSCVQTPWSSAYPDPKSAIVSINGTSGYLNRW